MNENQKIKEEIYREAAAAAKRIDNNQSTDMGKGAPRSVLYQTFYAATPSEVDNILNQDGYAYNYIYWNPQAVGIFITLAKPNPEAHKQQERIERQQLELSEMDAVIQARNCWVSAEDRETAEVTLIELYQKGYRLSKPIDVKVKP